MGKRKPWEKIPGRFFALYRYLKCNDRVCFQCVKLALTGLPEVEQGEGKN